MPLAEPSYVRKIGNGISWMWLLQPDWLVTMGNLGNPEKKKKNLHIALALTALSCGSFPKSCTSGGEAVVSFWLSLPWYPQFQGWVVVWCLVSFNQLWSWFPACFRPILHCLTTSQHNCVSSQLRKRRNRPAMRSCPELYLTLPDHTYSSSPGFSPEAFRSGFSFIPMHPPLFSSAGLSLPHWIAVGHCGMDHHRHRPV